MEPSLGVNWQATKDVALYANYSTAYKALAGATRTSRICLLHPLSRTSPCSIRSA
ncbi:MAG: TonB-dependent receptor [Acidiferrobacteraceae bacterium]